MTLVVYDAGVLVAADRNVRQVWAEHGVRLEAGVIPVVPAPVVAQVSRSPAQAQLRLLLRGCEVAPLTERLAHAAGQLLGRGGTSDVVDAVVAQTAIARRADVVTGDRADIARLLEASHAACQVVDLKSGSTALLHYCSLSSASLYSARAVLVEPTQGRVMADSYETLAADYDWLFGDDRLTGGAAINQPATAGLLQRIDPGSAVLDASCGTGINAAVLASQGFNVWATDGSEAMIEEAAARFRREHLAIPARRCLWADLPATVAERFDVVLCIGNSLVHAAGRDAMVEALAGLRQMARPGGHVVIDSRNWEKLHAERRIVQVADRVVMRRGRRCVVLYAWEIPDRLQDEHVAHIVFVFENGPQLEPHEHLVSFRPFTVAELRERLKLAGLTEVDADIDESCDRYAVVTVAS